MVIQTKKGANMYYVIHYKRENSCSFSHHVFASMYPANIMAEMVIQTGGRLVSIERTDNVVECLRVYQAELILEANPAPNFRVDDVMFVAPL